MKKVLGFIGWLILGVMAFDFIGFMAWATSGQLPVDSFYVGTITTHLLKLIF